MEKLLGRINYLARKKKSEGLTPEEIKEQQVLRQEYLKRFRANFRKQIENISIVDADGNETPVRSKKNKATDIASIIPGLKPESEYTAEEKQHVAELSEALATELGNPKKPTGEAGIQMLQRMNQSHAGLTEWALSFFDFKNDDYVLDIGCGGGATIKKISEKITDGKIFGLDYSEVALEQTKAYNIEVAEDEKLKLTLASVSKMPYDDDTFDKIISVESYFFWPDLINDLKEVRRVLKPDGKVIIASACYPYQDMPQTIKDNIRKYDMHCLNVEDFEKLLKDAGYRSFAAHTKTGEEWLVAEAVK